METIVNTIKVKGKTYRYDYFNKCEFCDLRGKDGECMLPKSHECGWTDIFKRVED